MTQFLVIIIIYRKPLKVDTIYGFIKFSSKVEVEEAIRWNYITYGYIVENLRVEWAKRQLKVDGAYTSWMVVICISQCFTFLFFLNTAMSFTFLAMNMVKALHHKYTAFVNDHGSSEFV